MKSLNFTNSLRAFCALAVVSLLAGGLWSDPVSAQSTSSSLRGQVVAPDGEAIANATVEILHVPSGTLARAQTGSTGQFFQSGLRVGGPYNVRVVADGYQETVRESVFLDPGSQAPLSLTLQESAADLDRVQVTGAVISQASELNNGVGSTFSARDIANQPSIDRDVIKTLLRDPLAQSDGVGNLSVAGVNPRFNGLSIDGSLQQDDFGLSDGTYATARSPINLDAVESASLVASDYSVTAQGFTGGLVNIVTKSGSNEFDGSVYYAYKDDSMVGDRWDDNSFDPGEFEEKEYGFTLGGPIIKDKLFFFVSYDEYENAAPVDFSNSDSFADRDPAFFEALRGVVQDVYGYDPLGRPQVASAPETSERTLVKLDWNINYDHRASFTYQNSEETGVSLGATSFESAWYDIPQTVEAYTAQLFSDWTYNFSTTLRVNYKENVRGQNCRAGSGVGAFEVNLNNDDLAGTELDGLLGDFSNTYTLGCDRFRHANEFEDDRLQIFASGDYYLGDHVLTFGGEYEELNVFNVFVASSNGRFVFTDFDQLVNRTPANVDYVNVPSNNSDDGAAAWGLDKLSLFVQDTWAITPDFELSYGLRYERYIQDDEPVFNQLASDQFGVDTSNNLDGNDLFLPRVGFLWTPLPRTSISGGFGLFAGGDPKVWTSNAFQVPTSFARITNATNVDINTIPQELLDQVAAAAEGEAIDYISDDFETPSDWKGSLRFEQGFDMNFGGFDLGDNYRFTAQYLYTRVNKGFRWENLGQTRLDEALPTGVAPDGRIIYADLDDLDLPNLTELTNYGSGESHVLTFGLGKVFENGLNFDISYAYQDVEGITEGTSSRGISNWRGIFDVDRNNPSPRTALFQIEDSFKINLGYERDFIGDLMTRVDVFGQIRSGTVWSTAYDVSNSNALFGRAGRGEGPFDNQPLYIPTPVSDSRVVYGSDFDQEGFFNFVEENGIPVGQIHTPYSNQSQWNNIWDLRFQQELPGIPGIGRFVGDNRFKLILDIENFLNLIDNDWGTFKEGPNFGQAPQVQADLVSAADVAANGIDGATALTGDAPRTTCLNEGDCVYRYNEFQDRDTQFLDSTRSVYEVRLTLRYDF